MTAKEKAIELIDIFCEYTNDSDKYEYAKKCALIAVDEILKDNKNQQIHWMPCENDLCGCYDYWLNVKHEIEKL